MSKYDKIIEIRKKIKDKTPSIGSWLQIPHSSIAEILGAANYDWVAVDMEHGSISISQLPELFRAIELGGTAPFVRLLDSSANSCKQALDAGALGVILPNIRSQTELKNAVEYCCWPPKGSRGVGFSRANLFGENFTDYDKFSQKPFIVAMIENKMGLQNIDNIIKVEGLDAILIGPYDLSASLGQTGNFENHLVVSAMKKILNLCKTTNISCGLHIVQPEKQQLINRIKEGYTFLPFSMDSVFLTKACVSPA